MHPRKIAEKGDRAETDALEFLYMRGPPNRIGFCPSRGNVLLVTGQRSFKAARKPERSKNEGALGIGNVIQHLAHTPFVRRVPATRIFLSDSGQEWRTLVELGFYRTQRIIAGHKIDVSEVVGGGFSGLGASLHGCDFSCYGNFLTRFDRWFFALWFNQRIARSRGIRREKAVSHGNI